MNRSTARLTVSIIALALLVAACGDDSGSPFGASTSPGDESTTSQAEASSTTAGEGQETTTTAGEETTTSQVGASGDVEELLAHFREVPIRTTYRLEDDQEITLSQDPTQDPPVSAVIYADGKMIAAGDSYIVCSGEGAGAICFTMPGSEGMDMATAFLGPFASLALTLQGGMTDIPGLDVETEQATIAGRSGLCFTMTPDAALGAGYEYLRSCVDAEMGFTLLVQIQETGGSELQTVMELLSYGDPEPGDFEPTGPVTTVPEG